MKIHPILNALPALLLLGPASAFARDQIRIVGSSTVYPFATVVAEEVGRSAGIKTPIIESTGTGGGFKLFCGGVGVGHPDIANASRAIKASEIELCAQNGVKEIVEVAIGFDGIVIAQSKSARPIDLTRKQIFLALAKQVPNAAGTLIPNPHMTWKDVDASLPDQRIEVLGPPPTSGTRDAFNELALEGGCNTIPELAALKDSDPDRHKQVCLSIREDGAFVEAGENDNLIVQKLLANDKAVGVFGYSFLEQNLDQLRGAKVDDVEPTFEQIASKAYPVSRLLYIYVKKAHVTSIPGIREFVAEFTSEKAVGDFGYLTEKGLIPMPTADRERVRSESGALKTLTPAAGH